MQRKASAVWQGDLKRGQGSFSTESGVLNKAQYSFSTRFENGIGTNPEELLAAAHAGCFAMALSNHALTQKGRELFPVIVALRQWGESYLSLLFTTLDDMKKLIVTILPRRQRFLAVNG